MNIAAEKGQLIYVLIKNPAIYCLLNNSVHAIHINFVFVFNGQLTSFARFTKCSFWIF